jgi:hypothetical protein
LVATYAHISLITKELQEIFGSGPNYVANYRDRLDVYSLAIDANVNEDERVVKCIAHQHAGIASRQGRQAVEGQQWYIQMWDNGPSSKYRCSIVVIDTEMGRGRNTVCLVWCHSERTKRCGKFGFKGIALWNFCADTIYYMPTSSQSQ